MCFTYVCNCSSGNVIFPIKVLSDSLDFQRISICTWAFNLNMFESEIQPAPTKCKKNKTTIVPCSAVQRLVLVAPITQARIASCTLICIPYLTLNAPSVTKFNLDLCRSCGVNSFKMKILT